MSADARVVELERQLSTLAVLQSVYCMDGEFATTDETAALLEAYNDGKDLNALLSASTTAQATLRVHLSEENIKQVSLNIHWLQRRGLDDAAAAAAEPLRIRPTQPTWLSRRAFEDLSSRFQARIAELPEDEKEDEVALVAFAVETVKELAIETQAASGQNNGATALANSASDTLVRIWMHLPSLSTKSKRNDLVTYAPTYSITGIVHAGKPGLLILEAPTASDVEAYLAEIKTYSWADIPSSHKKISERLREEGLTSNDRVFENMSEITEEINVNGMKGVRSNRGDLGALRDWLTARGLGGDRLAQILGTNLNET